MDIFTPAERSRIMSRIRSTGTKAEERLFQLTRVLTGRRKIIRNARQIVGCPDVFVPSLRLALFLDGCFFHSCPVHGHIPKSNSEYWKPKLDRNRRRDRRSRDQLRRQGIAVYRFWEHELKVKNAERVARRIKTAIRRADQRSKMSALDRPSSKAS